MSWLRCAAVPTVAPRNRDAHRTLPPQVAHGRIGDITETSMTPRTPIDPALPLDVHQPARDWSDRVALGITRGLRFLADTFFAKRYGNRAIVLETVAAVPGMV